MSGTAWVVTNASVNYTSKALNKKTVNAELRGTFYKLRKEYRKHIKNQKLNYRWMHPKKSSLS